MSKRLTQRRSAGFTLIEMSVSASLLALVVGGFFATFGGANQFAVNSRLKTSAKVILGSCLNETIGTPWTSTFRKEVHFDTSGVFVPFSPPNEGRNALPPKTDGEISLFTTPGGSETVTATLERSARVGDRSDLMVIAFRTTYTYRGVAAEPLTAYTVVARQD